MGFPGYAMELAEHVLTLPEVLHQAGYATFAVGKWHLTRDEATHNAATRRSWPVQRGFDRYYGCMGGLTNFFSPDRFQQGLGFGGPSQSPVSMVDAFFGGLSLVQLFVYVVAQTVGAAFGVVVANLMFALPAVTISTHSRSGSNLWLGETVVTFGLLLVLFGPTRDNLGLSCANRHFAEPRAVMWLP